MKPSKSQNKKNLTISLDKETIRKAKIIAATRSTSISTLVTEQIERLADEGELCEGAKLRAIALLNQEFHLGGVIRAKRDELHERYCLRRRM